MTENKYFIQFGCWNQGKCDIDAETNPVSSVMRKLREVINKENKPEFICVAGDNYYPKKISKKQKLIEPDNLISGFNCLPPDIEIDMIMGNHDLATNYDEDHKTHYIVGDPTIIEPVNSCFILEQEKIKTSDNNINLVLHKSRLINRALILMIDTTMYDESDVTEALPCYSTLLNTRPNIPTPSLTDAEAKAVSRQKIEELRTKQLDFVLHAIRGNIGNFDNVVIIGHHPIVGMKFKKEDQTNKIFKPFEAFIDLLQQIYLALSESPVKYYYLCADIHLYQQGRVTINIDSEKNMNIEQYIVGTGGTELDNNIMDNAFDNNKIDSRIGVTYTINESKEKYGFLKCNIGNEVTCEFIEADTETTHSSVNSENHSLTTTTATTATATRKNGGKTKKRRTTKKHSKRTKRSKRKNTKKKYSRKRL